MTKSHVNQKKDSSTGARWDATKTEKHTERDGEALSAYVVIKPQCSTKKEYNKVYSGVKCKSPWTKNTNSVCPKYNTPIW